MISCSHVRGDCPQPQLSSRYSPPVEAQRLDGKVVITTLANLSPWPASQLDSLRRVLKSESLVPLSEAFQIQRSLPHGHVAAVLGSLRRLGLEPILSRFPCPERDLVVALIVARILAPILQTRHLSRSPSKKRPPLRLAPLLGLGHDISGGPTLQCPGFGCLPANPASKMLSPSATCQTVLWSLYDLSSTYFEGRHCPLALLWPFAR